MNEPQETERELYTAVVEALGKSDYHKALEHCQELLRVVADPNIDMLRKNLMNKIKDENINTSIRRFVAECRKPLPPREAVLRPEILIPCFNQGRYLADTLSSLPAGVPVTIINDASTDDTAEHLYVLKETYDFKLLTNRANLNQSGSINRAVSLSGNNLFIVLNADDALVGYTISTVVAVMEEYGDVRMVGGDCIVFDDSSVLAQNRVLPTSLPYLPEPRIYLPLDALGFRQPNDINMTMSSCSFLRSAWEAVGGLWEFDRRVCSFDDRDFQMRVCALFPVAVLKEPLAFYRVNSSVGRGRCI